MQENISEKKCFLFNPSSEHTFQEEHLTKWVLYPLPLFSSLHRNQYNQYFIDSNIFSLSAILLLLYQDHSHFLCHGGGFGCKRIGMLRQFEELNSKPYVISSKEFLPPSVSFPLSGLKKKKWVFILSYFFLDAHCIWDRLCSFTFHAIMIH